MKLALPKVLLPEIVLKLVLVQQAECKSLSHRIFNWYGVCVLAI